jgi:hypothetical protein
MAPNGLIFNTNSTRPQNEIFIEKPYFFLESAVKIALIHLNSEHFPDSHQISKLSDISSRILVTLKKLRNSCLTAVNQMVDWVVLNCLMESRDQG